MSYMSDRPAAADSTPAGTSNVARVPGGLVAVIVNVALPLASFYALHAAGLPDVPALLLSGAWPLLDLAWVWWRARQLDEFGIFSLITLVLGAAAALLSHDARAVFLKDSVVTGLLGAAFLASLTHGRPLTHYLGRRFATDGTPTSRTEWDNLWTTQPAFRRLQRQLTTAWGLVLLAEAATRAELTWHLGTNAMVTVNNTAPYLIIAAMISISLAAGRHAETTAEHTS
jgi:uncharacterized membrane protein